MLMYIWKNKHIYYKKTHKNNDYNAEHHTKDCKFCINIIIKKRQMYLYN
jgi:hypothetical protein